MALIPGTLPSDTCYGTPQDLLELFAQYLDVPAFALNSKVVFSNASTGLTADVIWFNTGVAPGTTLNPILSINVSGWIDYITNYTKNASAVAVASGDYILFQDVSDSDKTKKTLVSDLATATVPNGSITPAKLSQPFTRATEVTVSGTSVSFTSIPSWAKRITVMFNAISTNGSAKPTIRLGTSSGAEASGYLGVTSNIGDSAATYSNLTTGFDVLQTGLSSIVFYGHMVLCNLSGNIWTCNSTIGRTDNNFYGFCSGAKTLGGTLDRVVFTTSNGTDSFDGGSVNIMYEG